MDFCLCFYILKIFGSKKIIVSRQYEKFLIKDIEFKFLQTKKNLRDKLNFYKEKKLIKLSA